MFLFLKAAALLMMEIISIKNYLIRVAKIFVFNCLENLETKVTEIFNLTIPTNKNQLRGAN